MKKTFSVGLLISTYNWPESLELVLQSVLQQTALPDQIIIADDGSDTSTEKIIYNYKQLFTIPIYHYWHKDDGFRKAAIINYAISKTNVDYIVQIDGDIVLNKYFIADHIALSETGYYIRGSRGMINEVTSNKILSDRDLSLLSPFMPGITNRLNVMRIPFLSSLLNKKSRRSDNFRGANCSYWRKDFIKINGYNNLISGWGHEDIELAARFINAGILQKKAKMMAVCYHIHHEYNDKKNEDLNFDVYLKSVKEGMIKCTNGIHEISTDTVNK